MKILRLLPLLFVLNLCYTNVFPIGTLKNGDVINTPSMSISNEEFLSINHSQTLRISNFSPVEKTATEDENKKNRYIYFHPLYGNVVYSENWFLYLSAGYSPKENVSYGIGATYLTPSTIIFARIKDHLRPAISNTNSPTHTTFNSATYALIPYVEFNYYPLSSTVTPFFNLKIGKTLPNTLIIDDDTDIYFKGLYRSIGIGLRWDIFDPLWITLNGNLFHFGKIVEPDGFSWQLEPRYLSIQLGIGINIFSSKFED